jgi:hypothetical protein
MDVDRLIVLDRGRVVADGPHHGLLAQGGLYAELWQRQSGGFNPDLKPNYGAEDGCRHAFANNRAVSLNWGRLGTIPRSPRPNLGSGSATIHPRTLRLGSAPSAASVPMAGAPLRPRARAPSGPSGPFYRRRANQHDVAVGERSLVRRGQADRELRT